MKLKFFFFLVLFLGLGAASFAQSKDDAAADKKDASAPVVTTDQSKAGNCAHDASTTAKGDCKWVDANNDGKCDACGMTAEECKEKCKKETTATKGCDPAACSGHSKEATKSSSCCPSKDGKK